MSSARDKTAGYETGPTPPTGAPGAAGSAAGAPAPRQAEPDYPRGDYGESRGVAQTGFTVLAATLMILSGLWSFLEGLVAIFRTGSFFNTLPNYTFQFSLHSWGWVHLGIGIALFA